MTTPKLVRDKIPSIIRASGQEPIVRVATAEEYGTLLRDKLLEEVREFLASGDLEELADILEVAYALVADAGVGREQLEKLRADKAAERGGFAAGIIWCGNRDPVAS